MGTQHRMGTVPDVQQMLTRQDDQVFMTVGAGETAVHINLGRFPYPPGAVGDLPNAPCRGMAPPESDLTGVEVAVVLEDADVVSGADGSGTVTLTNTLPTPVSFSYGSGVLVGVVVRPGTDAVVAEYVGGMTANLVGTTLEPGVPVTIHMIFSTAACKQSDGYALPPGDYELLVAKAGYGTEATAPLSATRAAFAVVNAPT